MLSAMAARSASIASFVLLLLHVVVVPSSSNHLKFNLYGSVFREIYATMKIGDTRRPSHHYNLHVDTGSVLTWVQCKVPRGYCEGPCKTWQQPHPLYHLIPRKTVGIRDPLCESSGPWIRIKPNIHGRCNYEMHYIEESSDGYLVKDMFTFRSNVHGYFAFGCGYNQKGEHESAPGDGVLGLGRGEQSLALTTQLKEAGVITRNVISHCFSSRGGGFLLLGETANPSGGIISSVPLLDRNNKNDAHYVAAVPAVLHFEGNPNHPISNNPMKVLFDSGTTYTYFDLEPYQMTVNEVTKYLHEIHAPLREVEDLRGHLCWEGSHNNKFTYVNEVKGFFKTLALTFTTAPNSRSTFEIPPENYLMINRRVNERSGNVCLAIVHDPSIDVGGVNLIGAVTMRDMIMIYDNEGKYIGWAHDPLCQAEMITSRL